MRTTSIKESKEKVHAWSHNCYAIPASDALLLCELFELISNKRSDGPFLLPIYFIEVPIRLEEITNKGFKVDSGDLGLVSIKEEISPLKRKLSKSSKIH